MNNSSPKRRRPIVALGVELVGGKQRRAHHAVARALHGRLVELAQAILLAGLARTRREVHAVDLRADQRVGDPPSVVELGQGNTQRDERERPHSLRGLKEPEYLPADKIVVTPRQRHRHDGLQPSRDSGLGRVFVHARSLGGATRTGQQVFPALLRPQEGGDVGESLRIQTHLLGAQHQ